MIRARGRVELDLARGDVVLLRGPNGCGKTSLLRALAGLDAPLGPYHVEPDLRGAPAAELPARVALSPQSPAHALVGLTVEGELRMRGRPMARDVAPLAERDVATLSSGEARRVALALADSGAPLLLLDEPAEGLDSDGRARVRALVQAGASRGAVVAADHAGLLDDLATRVVDLAPAVAAEDLPRVDAPRPARGDRPLLERASGVEDRAGRRLHMPALELGPGFHALVGPNGCGKSTLLLRLAREARAPLALADPRASFTRGSVAEELRGAPPGELVPPALLGRHPLTLSGGEAQRVSLARALGRPSLMVLLDEPEAHLDAAGRAALLRLVAARVREGACVLAATHDERLVERAGSVVRMEAAS